MSYGERINVKMGSWSEQQAAVERAVNLINHHAPMHGGGRGLGIPSFRGVPTSGGRDLAGSGKLGEVDREWMIRYNSRALNGELRYVLYSYFTPIAWLYLDPVTVQLKWEFPEVKYGPASTTHQSFARSVIRAHGTPASTFRAVMDKPVILLECEPEDQRPEDCFTDQADIAWVKWQQGIGNEWAWCVVKVTATVRHPNGIDTLEASEYLGACAYKSRKDFIETSMYYEDMARAATKAVTKLWNEAKEGVTV